MIHEQQPRDEQGVNEEIYSEKLVKELSTFLEGHGIGDSVFIALADIVDQRIANNELMQATAKWDYGMKHPNQDNFPYYNALATMEKMSKERQLEIVTDRINASRSRIKGYIEANEFLNNMGSLLDNALREEEVVENPDEFGIAIFEGFVNRVYTHAIHDKAKE